MISRQWQTVDQCEGDLRAVQLGDRDRAVECNDRRRVEPGQLVVQRDDLRPVRVRRRAGVGVDGVDRGEYLVAAGSVDREALAAVLKKDGAGYVGMIGSRRKVHRVFDALKQAVPVEKLKNVYAPIGLDIGADSPAEIAISVIGEILQVLRKRKGGHLRGAS